MKIKEVALVSILSFGFFPTILFPQTIPWYERDTISKMTTVDELRRKYTELRNCADEIDAFANFAFDRRNKWLAQEGIKPGNAGEQRNLFADEVHSIYYTRYEKQIARRPERLKGSGSLWSHIDSVNKGAGDLLEHVFWVCVTQAAQKQYGIQAPAFKWVRHKDRIDREIARWKGAYFRVDEFVSEFAGKAIATQGARKTSPEQLFADADRYAGEANLAKTRETLQQLIREYPGHPLASRAREALKVLPESAPSRTRPVEGAGKAVVAAKPDQSTAPDHAEKESRKSHAEPRHAPQFVANNCLSLVTDNTLYGGFRNACDYKVGFAWCARRPKADAWNASFDCEKPGGIASANTIGPNETSAHHTADAEIHWFACRNPESEQKDVQFVSGHLRGKCVSTSVGEPGESGGASRGGSGQSRQARTVSAPVGPPPAPKDACGKRRLFALNQCLVRECEKPQFKGHAQCKSFE